MITLGPHTIRDLQGPSLITPAKWAKGTRELCDFLQLHVYLWSPLNRKVFRKRKSLCGIRKVFSPSWLVPFDSASQAGKLRVLLVLGEERPPRTGALVPSFVTEWRLSWGLPTSGFSVGFPAARPLGRRGSRRARLRQGNTCQGLPWSTGWGQSEAGECGLSGSPRNAPDTRGWSTSKLATSGPKPRSPKTLKCNLCPHVSA